MVFSSDRQPGDWGLEEIAQLAGQLAECLVCPQGFLSGPLLALPNDAGLILAAAGRACTLQSDLVMGLEQVVWVLT